MQLEWLGRDHDDSFSVSSCLGALVVEEKGIALDVILASGE